MSQGWAVVTGATAGIGREFCSQLAARGYDLVLVARDTERLESTGVELTDEFGVQTEVLTADLSTRAGTDAVAVRIADQSRPVTFLVNNAGFGARDRFADTPLEVEQQMLDLLVTAVMRLSHAAVRAMPPGSGIINVSSVAAFLPRGTYSSAKAWVNAFSTWAAVEYRPQGIKVMALCPGFVKTEFHERLGIDRDGSAPAAMWLEPDRVVREGLADWDAGRSVSIPTKRYKAIVAVGRMVPRRIMQRTQSVGRK